MKKLTNILLGILALVIQNVTNADNVTKTFEYKASLADITAFERTQVGLKANTANGMVKVRVFLKDTYNFDNEDNNSSLLFGFYSENNSNTSIYVQTG